MRRFLLLAVPLFLLTACGQGGPAGDDAGNAEADSASADPSTEAASEPDAETEQPEPEGELLVFAAASLTDVFAEVARAFSAEYPGVEITYNVAGSQQLAGQIVEGAPADVFASANLTQMDVVGDAGLIAGEPEVFTANLLEVAVEAGNPMRIGSLSDLANPDLALVLAAPEVPAGQYAQEALDAAGITVTPSSLEPDVRAALSRVTLGEADAAIVYRSDIAAASGDVEGIEIPEGRNVPAAYPIAVLAGAPNPDAAEAFTAFVLADQGQEILADYGFAPAPWAPAP